MGPVRSLSSSSSTNKSIYKNHSAVPTTSSLDKDLWGIILLQKRTLRVISCLSSSQYASARRFWTWMTRLLSVPGARPRSTLTAWDSSSILNAPSVSKTCHASLSTLTRECKMLPLRTPILPNARTSVHPSRCLPPAWTKSRSQLRNWHTRVWKMTKFCRTSSLLWLTP